MSDFLEFRLLKYIVAVAETSNFTRAAERLFLAQPSLSKQIRALENEIQFPIFERGRDGVKITPAGEMILAYARETLKARDELISMARAVHLRRVAPLKLGFGCFVNTALLQFFRMRYNSMFPGCEIQLIGGDPTQILQKITEQHIDCAFLQMPIDPDLFHVQQVSQSGIAICLRGDDALAVRAQVDIRDIAHRITIFQNPELQPAAHARLVEMFDELGIQMNIACYASSPTDIQWMVKSGYGLALVDHASVLDSELITRPLAGISWTIDTGFVYHNRCDHIALPFIERFLTQEWRSKTRTISAISVRPEQLKLLA